MERAGTGARPPLAPITPTRPGGLLNQGSSNLHCTIRNDSSGIPISSAASSHRVCVLRILSCHFDSANNRSSLRQQNTSKHPPVPPALARIRSKIDRCLAGNGSLTGVGQYLVK